MSGRDDDRSAPADAAEPQRLIEDAGLYGSAPEGSWALGLLRRAEPYRTPAGRKQRVQLRLGHRARRRAPLVFLRFAVAACVLLGGAAIVSAAIGHWPTWVTSAYERVVGPRAEAPARTRARAHVARHVAAPPAPEQQKAEEVPWPDIPIVPEAEPPAPRRAPRAAAAPRPHPVAAPAPAPAVGEDASAVSAAMRALRVERNPVRARVLLARYLADHPTGNLAEEALALSIEAALAHHDGDVAALANRYLRLYPRGSFQTLARDALVAQPPVSGATQIP